MENVGKKRRKESEEEKEERRTRLTKKVNSQVSIITIKRENVTATDRNSYKVYYKEKKQEISTLSPSPAASAAPSATSQTTTTVTLKAPPTAYQKSSNTPTATHWTPPAATARDSTTISIYTAPFTEGEDILVHVEDGLIYFGVVVEVVEEQGQCLVRFGDSTERWSSFHELQRLGEISEDECSPPSTPAPPQFVGTEEEETETSDKQSGSTVPKNLMRVHTPEKLADERPYCCTQCATSVSLKRHVSIDTGEKRHICTQCNYSFSTADNLEVHMRAHTGDKPFGCAFSCPLCDFSFSRSYNLTIHMRVHIGKKPAEEKRHRCTKCDYSCSRAKHLEMHMRVHSGEKPYSCTQCNYSSAQSTNLKRHVVRNHTGKNPFNCSQ